MATYFHGGQEIQPDGLQTLYLMNPGFSGYSDAPTQANMVFPLNPMTQHANQTHHFVGIPVQAAVTPDSNQQSSIHYNLWNNANYRTATEQGLSLSLSEPEIPALMPEIPPASTKEVGMMSSKYLKVAQQLLDEVVNAGKGIKAWSTVKENDSSSQKHGEGMDGGDGSEKRAAELTTVERQELQMKKAKLVNMLNEVEQRYRQYNNQMQLVISAFEAAAGFGAARTYTTLALETISKQFRCLRDAITGQIQATSKSSGEEDSFGGGGTKSGSRLQFVDHHLRQQRALQQLGMIQHNAWRPQRGLPERSVSVLRAWLFEHFLHPYPKDSDKQMLAKQTGLTRSQVSNWFINARVRLWKPMVEEMYAEEMREQEQNHGNEESKKSNSANEDSTSKSSDHQENSPARTEQTDLTSGNIHTHASFNDDELIMQSKLKKARTTDESMNVDRNNQELLMKFGSGIGGYSISDIGRFDHDQFTPRFSGNGVSLTLGLTHSLSGVQPTYISSESIPFGRRIEMSSTENNDYPGLSSIPSVAHPSSNGYENINIQSSKRFAAQLLPDFVA